VLQADKTNSNSFTLFISKWRTLEIARIQPYVQTYMKTRQALIQYYRSSLNEHQGALVKLRGYLKRELAIDLVKEESWQLPHHLAIKSPAVYKMHSSFAYKKKLQNRTEINLWILSTIEFTGNQRKEKGLFDGNAQLDN
jgi:hypothetical protein